MKHTLLLALAALGLAVRPALAQSLTLNTGDTITVNGSGTAGNIGLTVYTPPNSMTTINATLNYAVSTNGTSTFTLGTGGTLTGSTFGLTANGSGLITVTGGTITNTVGGSCLYAAGSGPVAVSGGTFTIGTNSDGLANIGSGSLTVTGGTFTGGIYDLAALSSSSTIDLYGDFGLPFGTSQAIPTDPNNGVKSSFYGRLQNSAAGQTFTYKNFGTITQHQTVAPEPSPAAVLAIGIFGLGARALKARKRTA